MSQRRRANDPCWCGSGQKLKRCHGDHDSHRRRPVEPGVVSPVRDVPEQLVRPAYVATGGWPENERGVQILRGEVLERARRAGRIAAEVLIETGSAVAPGVTTDALDAIAHEAYLRRGACPSTWNYKSYTKSICTSVNDVICHGIPDDRALETGDIVNIDVTAFVDGLHGDTSATFLVGGPDAVDEPTRVLVASTAEATRRGIAAVRPGGHLHDIGRAIEPFAMDRGFGVVRDYGGHGIGEVFHADPHVFHVDQRRDGIRFVPGLCFTVEPMFTAGTHKHEQWDDGWTVVTADGLPSAQFEHTVVVTDDGVEILTVTESGETAVDWQA